jgi:hypothetical protein
MAVDFASKQRDRAGKGWGLRNAKLRMSRKLIFASGLLVCFSAYLDPDLQTKISTDRKDGIKLTLLQHIRDCVRLTPLEILAKSMERYGVSHSIAKNLFDAYTEFLKLLSDEKSRKALEKLKSVDSRTDPTFRQIREISTVFEGALDHIFFKNKLIEPLTRKYGVF